MRISTDFCEFKEFCENLSDEHGKHDSKTSDLKVTANFTLISSLLCVYFIRKKFIAIFFVFSARTQFIDEIYRKKLKFLKNFKKFKENP